MKLYLTSVACNVLDKTDFESKKKVAFISTAADLYDDKFFVEDDRDALKNKGLDIENYDLKGKNKDQLLDELQNYEIIFVSGRNSFYLLEKINNRALKDVVCWC